MAACLASASSGRRSTAPLQHNTARQTAPLGRRSTAIVIPIIIRRPQHQCPACGTRVYITDAYCSACGNEFSHHDKQRMRDVYAAQYRRTMALAGIVAAVVAVTYILVRS